MSEVSPPAAGDVRAASDVRYCAGDLIQEKYRLIRHLGQGGFGMVWVALNVVLEVHVALKLIELEEDERAVQGERLLEEARAAARLAHPGIVRVFDFGRTSQGDPFVVMELLHGESLYDKFRRRTRLSAVEAVKLLLPIADALAAAHSKDIIHRDVKPDNIVLALDESGRIQPKLLDFGIARRVDVDRKLTAKGSVVGTPDYMSPEQARGMNMVDARADVWSFCVVLYELITGVVPFGGDNYNALLWSIIESPPAPIMQHAAGDEELWLVLEKGLQKRVEDRWDSMHALGAALASWLVSHDVFEDVCGTSLKAAWLDSNMPTLPPSSNVPMQSPASHPRALTLSGAIADTPAPPRSRRKTVLVAVALGLAVLAVGGFVTVRGVAGRHVEPDVEGTGASTFASSAQAEPAEPAASTAARAALAEPAPAPSASGAADAGAASKKRLWRGKKRNKAVDFGF